MNRAPQKQSNSLKALKPLRLDALSRGVSLYGLPAGITKKSSNPYRKVPNTGANRKQISSIQLKTSADVDKQTQAYQSLHCLNINLSEDVLGVGYIEKTTSENRSIPTYDEKQLAPELWSACTLWITHLLELPGPASESVCEQLQEFLTNKFIFWMEFVTAHGQYVGLKGFLQWLKEKSAQFPIKVHFNGVEVVNFLKKLAACLEFMGRTEENLDVYRDRAEIFRHICNESFVLEYRAKFGRALYLLSRALGIQEKFGDAINVSREAVGIQRQLDKEYDTTGTRADLANALHNQSFILNELGHHPEALEAAREANTILKKLVTVEPAKFNPLFVESIGTLANRLSKLKQMEESLEMMRAAVAIRRQLATDDPVEYTPGLGTCLHNLGATLSDMGHGQEALEVKRESVDIYRKLAADHPTAFLDGLAHMLTGLSSEYSLCGEPAKALPISDESVAIYRTLVAKNPGKRTFWLGLRDSLQWLACAHFDTGAIEKARTSEKELRDIEEHMMILL